MKKTFLLLSLLVMTLISHGQIDTSLFNRLQAITNTTITFYNVDGISITTEQVNKEFNPKNIVKNFKKYGITSEGLQASSNNLIKAGLTHFQSSTESGVAMNTTYIFFPQNDKSFTAVSYASMNKRDSLFETDFTNLIMEKKIPQHVYSPMVANEINFAGRQIKIGSSCVWRNVNTVQCPYYGEMDWSVHRLADDAELRIQSKLTSLRNQNGTKVVSEELIDVKFEGNDAKAHRLVLDITGVNSMLVNMSGGKTLTVYLLAAPIRGNFISCVMSHWNNDQIRASGLPALLDEVMFLKK